MGTTNHLEVSNLLTQVQMYLNNREDENARLTSELESIRRENAKLMQNERDMLKVSTIVNITNENIKLKNYISMLEAKLQKLTEKKSFAHNSGDTEAVQPDECNPDVSEETCVAEPDQSRTTKPPLRQIVYKKKLYFYDTSNKVYAYLDENTPGEEVGRLRFSAKTQKHKVVFSPTD